MPLSCTLDSVPLLKILLHATKYPASPINGLLLGTATGATGGEASAAPSLQIVDAVPLFHTFLHLALPLETALYQVSAYAKSRGLQVVGLYHANERLDDREFGTGPRRIADKLQQQCSPLSCGLLLDNVRMGSFLRGQDTSFAELYTRPEGMRGAWSAAAAASGQLLHAAGNVPQLYNDYVAQGRHRRLADFDEHLDDVGRDWTNTGLLD